LITPELVKRTVEYLQHLHQGIAPPRRVWDHIEAEGGPTIWTFGIHGGLLWFVTQTGQMLCRKARLDKRIPRSSAAPSTPFRLKTVRKRTPMASIQDVLNPWTLLLLIRSMRIMFKRRIFSSRGSSFIWFVTPSPSIVRSWLPANSVCSRFYATRSSGRTQLSPTASRRGLLLWICYSRMEISIYLALGFKIVWHFFLKF